jgi:glycosyltransferase involved in cell wall biosynthesis
MPVWNPDPRWLADAVASALTDPGCDVELIMVDDGNEQPVSELLTVVDGRIRHVRVPHGGVAAARNAGTAAVRGTHVRYIDADDVVAPGSTGRLLELAGEHAIGCLDTAVCDEDLVVTRRMHTDVSGDAVRACLLGPFEVRIVSLMFPRWVVTAAGEFDPATRQTEDWDFVLRCLEQAPLRPGSEIAYYYRRHGASVTRSVDDVASAEAGARRVLEKWVERHPEERWSRLHRQARASMEADHAMRWLSRGNYVNFGRGAVRASMSQPSRLPGLVRTGLRRGGSRLVARVTHGKGRPRR